MSTFDPPAGPSPDRTVTVTGRATASVPPDRATITLGVQARAGSAGEAMSTASQRAAALVGALRERGAADADLRTSNLSLWSEQPQPGVVQYVASNMLSVTVGADDVGAAIDAAAAAAGNDFALHGVGFSISDPAEAVAPLRAEALADARARADALAAPEGLRAGAALTIVEGGGAASPVAKGVADTARLMSTPVEPGSESLALSVTVTYELLAGDAATR